MSDLQKLFDTDPLQLSSQDIDTIIASFRAARANFNLTGQGAKVKKEKVGATKIESIDLDDLMKGVT